MRRRKGKQQFIGWANTVLVTFASVAVVALLAMISLCGNSKLEGMYVAAFLAEMLLLLGGEGYTFATLLVRHV
jgi:hypothetical protein